MWRGGDDCSYSLPIACECCVNDRLLSPSFNSKEKLRCILCRYTVDVSSTMSWPRDKKTREMQYSWGGGRSRCGRHPAMNPNEVQLLTLTPGSLLSNPHLPLSHPSLPSSSSCPSVSQPPHPFALWLPLWPLLPLSPPPNLFYLLLCSSCLLPFVFKLSLFTLSSSVFLYAGLKKKKKNYLS